MAWELPSKPVDLNEYLQGSNGELQDVHRNDKNVTYAPKYAYPTKTISNNVHRIDSNGYYTNIPMHSKKIVYEKKNQYQSPYKSSYEKYKYKSSIPDDSMAVPISSNKLPNYITYADSLMKQFKRLTETIPPNRIPFSPVKLQEFANM